MKTRLQMIPRLVLTTFVTSVLAQEVSIPDPSLNAAIRGALQKPAGPLTADELLSLSNLNAYNRGVRNLEGLGAAHNLTWLNLSFNQLTSLTLLAGLTNLNSLDLSQN